MQPTPPQQPASPIKIRYIWTPVLRPCVAERVATILGSVLSYVLAFAGIMYLLFALFPALENWLPGASFLMPSFLAFPAPAFWLWFMNRRPYRKAHSQQPFRAKRLAGCLATPDGINRLPHRLLEQLFRTGPLRRRQLLHVVRQMPPGSVVYANLHRDKRVPRPAANAISFEPVDIGQDFEGLTWLCVMNLEQQNVIAPPSQSRSPVEQPATIREQLSAFGRFFQHRWSLILWLPLAYSWWRRGWTKTDLLLLAFLVPSAIVAWILPLFRERSWWLVPGGLICREFRFWRKDVEAKLFTPADTPLFLDAQVGLGYLLDHHERVVKFHCAEAVSWAIAAGWISTARTPTLDEVRAFLGQP